MRQSSVTNVDDLLSRGEGTLAPLLRHARRLREVERDVLGTLDRALRPHCRVANVRDDTLVLDADSPVWASRLRYQTAELLERLPCREALGIRRVRVRVRPAHAPPGAAAPRPRRLSPTAAALIYSVARTVDPGPLRRALLRLASRGRHA